MSTDTPAQWRMVPVEPTEAMHVAAVRTIVNCTGNDDFPPRVWAAMLAASPQPTAAQEPAAPFSIVFAICRMALHSPTEALLHQIERLAKVMTGHEQQSLQALLLRARDPRPQRPVTPLVPSATAPTHAVQEEIPMTLKERQKMLRPAFEAFAIGKCMNLQRDSDLPDTYADSRVDAAWAAWQEAAPTQEPTPKADRVHALVNAGPYPGMSEAFDDHMGAVCWSDLVYRQDAATWAVAWKATLRQSAAPTQAVQEPVAQTEFCWLVEEWGSNGNSTGRYMLSQVDLTITADVYKARKFRSMRAAMFRADDMRKQHGGDWRHVQHGFGLDTPVPTHAVDAKGTSDCPICGHDTPHGHDQQDIVLWLRKQAARFIPDAATRLHIDLVGEEEAKLRARIRELEKTVEDQDEVGRQIMHLDYARHSNTAAPTQAVAELVAALKQKAHDVDGHCDIVTVSDLLEALSRAPGAGTPNQLPQR